MLVDVWEVGRLFTSASAALRDGDEIRFLAAGEKTAAVYRGAFLASDTDADWAVSLRERLRVRFI